MKHLFTFAAALCVVISCCSCRSVYSANRANPAEMMLESSIVFTRPCKFTPFFGSYSLSEFVEIVYERAGKNAAGQLVVEVGIRNRGPVSWTNWYVDAPQRITLKTVCNFYQGNRVVSPMVFSTNRREIIIGRGETFSYKAVCPVDAVSYQLILGD